jgi:hypothetical protein
VAISFSCHHNSSHNWEDYYVQASHRDDDGELLDAHVERKHFFLDGSCKDLDNRNVVDASASAADQLGVALWLSFDGVLLYLIWHRQNMAIATMVEILWQSLGDLANLGSF